MNEPYNQAQNERARSSLRASFVGLAVNACLALSKIIAGSISGSVSILADGINNLADTGSVLISWLSMYLARKPGDKNHPFGHGRMEYIGSLAIAVLIIYVGIDLIKSSLDAILRPQAPTFSWWIAGLTALSIPAKLFLYRYYKKHGRAYNMTTLLAAAQDSINDVVISLAVLSGLFASHFLNLLVDGWLGLLVSVFILISGFKLIRDMMNALIGGQPDRELGNKILRILARYPEITDTHDFVLHDYGPGRSMASIHAEVDADSQLIEIHDVVDQAEQDIMQELGLSITIHMDPTLPSDAPGQEVKSELKAFLASRTPPLSLHDFRLVPGRRIIKLIFDVSVPVDYQAEGLIKEIETFARSLDPRYQCVIQIDRDYFNENIEQS